jgi:predicted GH43/DUF377 family glycosyl hydrolase
MKRNAMLATLWIATIFFTSCSEQSSRNEHLESDEWQIGPFEKISSQNPVLTPIASSTFFCPVRKDTVFWESKDVFNPASFVRNDTLFLLYRAEDKVGKFAGTSRLGLAYSLDGTSFTRMPEPVFYPDDDEYKVYEWEGGAEDPRIVETEEGAYFLTYTSYDGEFARLCIAETKDLHSWIKHGPVFSQTEKYLDHWSKAGAIICRKQGDKFIASKINDSYWMYWGDTDLFLASSPDLVNWTPVEDENGELVSVMKPREGMFDSRLVESGPPAFITDNGILLFYNGMNLDSGGDPNLPAGTYSSGQALFDSNDPSRLINRSEHYFLTPSEEYEILGQIGNVCFIEGLVDYKGKWFLYYGTADSKIAVAWADSL